MFASGPMLVDDDMIIDDEVTEVILNNDLEQQICNAIDPRFLLQLVLPSWHFILVFKMKNLH